jgi:transcription elongation factor GreA
MSEDAYLTQAGADELRRELDMLVNERRPELALRLKEAVSDGDLKENANYHDAKEQQSLMEGRILYLQDVLRRAKIITNDGTTDKVQVGHTVTIQEVGEDSKEVYQLVGAAEANPKEGRLSVKSPIGQALLNHKKGDKVKVQVPDGEITFKIVKIE